MELKLYEILMLFAIYSVIGWAIEEILCLIRGKVLDRGIMKAPASYLYGTGGILLIVLVQLYKSNLTLLITSSVILGLQLEILAVLLLYVISGVTLWKDYFIGGIVASLIGLAIVVYLNSFFMALIYALPTFLTLVFLILFYWYTLSSFIDGVFLLGNYRRDMKKAERIKKAPNLPIVVWKEIMSPYKRLIKAYPTFAEKTKQKINHLIG